LLQRGCEVSLGLRKLIELGQNDPEQIERADMGVVCRSTFLKASAASESWPAWSEVRPLRSSSSVLKDIHVTAARGRFGVEDSRVAANLSEVG
jgi:hypothetical protein